MASKYVVTAAHCLIAKDKEGKPVALGEKFWVVRLGDHNINTTGETIIPEKTVKVSKVFTHEKYNVTFNYNDIALLELAEEVDLDVYTPACMARATDVTTFDGMMAQVYGWGRTQVNDPGSKLLLEVDVPVVTNEVCNEAWLAAIREKYPDEEISDFDFIDEGQICAGGVEGEDSCKVNHLHFIFLSQSVFRVIVEVL